jgi:hypothetical protein
MTFAVFLTIAERTYHPYNELHPFFIKIGIKLGQKLATLQPNSCPPFSFFFETGINVL